MNSPEMATIHPITADRDSPPQDVIPTFQPLPLLRILANNLERDCCVDEAMLIRSCAAALAFDDADKHLLLSVVELLEGMADEITKPKWMAEKHLAMAKRIREIVRCR